MYVTSPPTTFNPAKLIRKMVLAVVIGSVLAPIADYIQGVGPGILGDTKDAAATVVADYQAAQATQSELFRGVDLP